MMTTILLKYLVLIATFGSAFIAVGYEDDARKRGWPVGSLLSGSATWLKILAFIALLLTLGLGFHLFHWWTPLVVAVAGFLFGLIATQLMGAKVQFVAIAGTVLGWILCLTYVF